MASTTEKQQSHAPNRGGASDFPHYEDALFVVHVLPKEASGSSADSAVITPAVSSSSVLTSFMPSPAGGSKTYSLPLVIGDGRGGMSARQPSRVQLFTKSGVSMALFSHTLAAEDVVDAFIACRDRHLDDPRARAAALKDMLRDLYNDEHTFSLAAFDDSARAFVAWTPRSAPISFGHHLDGSVVVVGSSPRSKTLVGHQMNGDVHLAHLPAGRFVYGHAFLKPFEFTSMWSTATGNRAGASAQVRLGVHLSEHQHHHQRHGQNLPESSPHRASPPGSPESATSYSSSSSSSVSVVDPPAVFDLDKPKLSPAESSKWRWAKTGSRAEVADTWKKTVTAAVDDAKKEEKKTTRASAANQIAAIAETVAALAASASNIHVMKTKTKPQPIVVEAPTRRPAACVEKEKEKENTTLPAVAVSVAVTNAPASEKKNNDGGGGSFRVTSSSAPACSPEQLLTFGVGAVICNLMNRNGPRINRFDTHPDKRFLTLLLLRFAVLTDKPFSSSEERRDQMLRALEPVAGWNNNKSALAIEGLGGSTSFANTMRKTAEAQFAGRSGGSRPGTAASERAKQLKAASRRKRRSTLPVALTDGNNSSIVMCQPNGTCCVGNHCFV